MLLNLFLGRKEMSGLAGIALVGGILLIVRRPLVAGVNKLNSWACGVLDKKLEEDRKFFEKKD